MEDVGLKWRRGRCREELEIIDRIDSLDAHVRGNFSDGDDLADYISAQFALAEYRSAQRARWLWLVLLSWIAAGILAPLLRHYL